MAALANDVRGGGRRGFTPARLTAVLTVLIAVLLVAELLDGSAVAPYDVALVGSVVLGAVVTGIRMWRRTSFETRGWAVLLAILVLAGQLLVSTVGVPGGGPSHWSATGFAVVALSLAIPALVAVDARHAWRVERAEHPYAL